MNRHVLDGRVHERRGKGRPARRAVPDVAVVRLDLQARQAPVETRAQPVAAEQAAAREAGCKAVILPKENERETNDLPPEIYKGIRLIFAEKADEAFKEVLL